MPSHFDLVYDDPGGVPLRYDLFTPDGPGPHPLVVCVHGGGWISGEKEGMREVASSLALHGFAAACPEYRLAPLHPFPAAVRDVQVFVAHCRRIAREINICADHIASLGNSAGGHLAAMLAVTDGEFLEDSESVSTRVQCAVAICALTDLRDAPAKHFPISLTFIEQFLGGPYEGNEDRYAAASPLVYVGERSSPMLLIHGEADDIVPVEQSVALATALRAAGVPVELHTLPGEGHSFSLNGWAWIERSYLDYLTRNLVGQAAQA